MIDSYSFGRVSVEGRTYHADLIIYPERVDSSWWRREAHTVGVEDLEEVLRYQPQVLVIGQGKPGLMKVSPQLSERLRQQGIELFAAPTARAVRRYNELCGHEKVVAALHLTC